MNFDNLKFHDLRYTYASIMLSKTANIIMTSAKRIFKQ